MNETIKSLPTYLQKYCINHDVEKYTSRDHAAWRYIMTRALAFFREHAIDGYEEGLKLTGLPVDRIPGGGTDQCP